MTDEELAKTVIDQANFQHSEYNIPYSEMDRLARAFLDAQQEIKRLHSLLHIMTAARDEACLLASKINNDAWVRHSTPWRSNELDIEALQKVGK